MIFAITGGIGTGKSEVLKILKKKYLVFNADDISHEIINETQIITQIVDNFGLDILEDNKINRKKLAKIVFSSKEKLELLNKIMHPSIIEKIIQICSEYENKKQFVFFEVPLLFELNLQKYFNKVILVYSQYDIRLNRIVKRDNISIKEARAKIDSQMDLDIKKQMSDYCIYNNTSIMDLENNLELVLKELENGSIKC